MHSLSLLVALSLSAPPAAPLDASAAFGKLKQLDGSWKTDAKAGPVQYVAIRVVGDGAAVLETHTASDRTTVTAVVLYALENGELLATHHGVGGASRLKLSGADAGGLRFEAASKDAAVLSLALLLKDNKVREEWLVREGPRQVKKPLELLSEYVDTLK